MDGWDSLQAAGSFIFILCLVPQFYRTLQRGRAEDVSLAFLVLVIAGSLVVLPYSAHTRQWFFLASFSANLVVWGTVLYYRVRPRPD